MINPTLKEILSSGDQTVRELVLVLVKDPGVAEVELDGKSGLMSIEDTKGNKADVPNYTIGDSGNNKLEEYIKAVHRKIDGNDSITFSDWAMRVEYNRRKRQWKLNLKRTNTLQDSVGIAIRVRNTISTRFEVVD